jgi:hypothetical protein
MRRPALRFFFPTAVSRLALLEDFAAVFPFALAERGVELLDVVRVLAACLFGGVDVWGAPRGRRALLARLG